MLACWQRTLNILNTEVSLNNYIKNSGLLFNTKPIINIY